MAQAARLNLRMQKELKLLLTDPPPGASFPFLSSDSDFSSLSTIHAQIEGPEGTVYAKGVFEVKIQIPERYPFQPPSVTFATPIYHPNIDNGGRICLDILNLPPKGAWQPSLNISTVLTSIGLLLSEPNPDDGLMCEASQEYKYNRQAFDLKARSMTEKYAKTGIGGSQESRLEINETVSTHKMPCLINWKLSLDSSSSIQSLGNDVEVNEMEAKGKRKEVNNTLDECNLRQAKLCGTRRKLSLESSCQIQERNGHENENLVANQSPAISMDYPGSAMLQHDICSRQKHHLHQTSDPMNGNLSTSSQQPSQFNQKRASINSFPTSDGDNKKLLAESQVLLFQSNSNVSDGASSVSLPVDSNELQPHKDCVKKMGNGSTDATCKRISSVGKKLSLGSKGSSQGQEKDNKENVVPIHKVPVSSPQNSYRKSGIGRKLTLGPPRQLQGDNYNNCQLPHPENLSMDGMSLPLSQDHRCNVKQYNPDRDEQQKIEGSPISEAIVVLDSEDSEEETDGALRLKLLARKRKGNWRAKA